MHMVKSTQIYYPHYQNCYEHRHWKSIVFTFFSEDCSEVQNQEKYIAHGTWLEPGGANWFLLRPLKDPQLRIVAKKECHRP